jgi:uncharacterized protein YkwD
MMKSLTNRKDKSWPTDLCGTSRYIRNATQTYPAKRWKVCGCQVTLLPMPSHILLTRTDAMRPLLALVAFAVSGSAQGQFPYSYAPYTPRDLPYVGEHALPVQGRTSRSLAQAMLDAHNAVRARVGVPSLVWSDQLAEVAQDWAIQLIATSGLSHRPDNRYGENIYTLSGGTASPAQVVDFWAAEAHSYDIRSNTCRGVCGHYTQVIWGKTRAVGCAVASDRRRELWVCNYDPPGNVVGYRPY